MMSGIKKIFLIMIFTTQTLGSICISQQTTVSVSNTTTNQFLEEYYTTEGEKRKEEIKTPNPFVTILKIIFYLALLGGGGYFLIRWIITRSAIPQTEDSQFIEIVLTKAVGLNTYIHIAKIINDYYILSQSGDGLRLIEKVTDKETIDFIELNKEKMKPKSVKFIDILGTLPLHKRTDKIGFIKAQKERLKKL